jgi:molybdopterin-guanine dinucleotide biosynthesis protein A
LIRLRDGETAVEHLLRLSTGPAFVSTNYPEWYERLDVPLVADLVPDKGAPGGVVTGLAVAATEWVTIVACDMPFVTAQMLEVLHARRHAGVDVVCFTRAGQLEPLVGLYRRALCFDWEPRLDGNPSLRELVSSVRLETIEADEPARLVSLNSPDDFRKAAESFRESGVAVTLPPQAPPW